MRKKIKIIETFPMMITSIFVERKKEGNACEKMDESNICDDIRVLDVSFHGRYNTRTSAN